MSKKKTKTVHPPFNFQADDQSGFTLIEMVVVIFILASILTISAVSVGNSVSEPKQRSAKADLISLLREAQNKSINGDTEGDQQTNSYGVHFSPNSYTLFKGTSFYSNDPANFVIKAPDGVMVTSYLPCSSSSDCNNLVFNKASGEVLNFDPSKNYVCLSGNSLGSSILFTVNYLGVVDAKTGC